MAGITLAQAQAKLDAYLLAEEAVLTGQQYTIADRTLQRAPLNQIQAGRAFWEGRVQELSMRASGRGRSIVPRTVF